MTRYAISKDGSTPVDSVAIDYRAVGTSDTLTAFEVEWNGTMPPFPAWDAATQAPVSRPDLYGNDGLPL